MNLNKPSWQTLSINLTALGLTFLLLTLLLGWVNHYRLQQAQALSVQINRLNQIKLGLEKLKIELAILNKYGPHYATLLDQAKRHEGLLNPLNKTAWITHLQAQQKNLQLFNISYSINSSEAFKPVFFGQSADLPVKLSQITFDLDLLHEADLVLLNEALATNKTAVFIWQGCEISRLQPSPWPSHQVNANLHAKCALTSVGLFQLLPKQGFLP